MTSRQRIFAPMKVEGQQVDLSRMVDVLASAPERFKACELVRAIPGDYHFAQEVLNRLMQRWRKLGLCVFEKGGRWRLTEDAWSRIQDAHHDAFVAEAAPQ